MSRMARMLPMPQPPTETPITSTTTEGNPVSENQEDPDKEENDGDEEEEEGEEEVEEKEEEITPADDDNGESEPLTDDENGEPTNGIASGEDPSILARASGDNSLVDPMPTARRTTKKAVTTKKPTQNSGNYRYYYQYMPPPKQQNRYFNAFAFSQRFQSSYKWLFG